MSVNKESCLIFCKWKQNLTTKHVEILSVAVPWRNEFSLYQICYWARICRASISANNTVYWLVWIVTFLLLFKKCTLPFNETKLSWDDNLSFLNSPKSPCCNGLVISLLRDDCRVLGQGAVHLKLTTQTQFVGLPFFCKRSIDPEDSPKRCSLSSEGGAEGLEWRSKQALGK